jgi:dipeptidyl aminopeptidase/acylaminoacyl peptidase
LKLPVSWKVSLTIVSSNPRASDRRGASTTVVGRGSAALGLTAGHFSNRSGGAGAIRFRGRSSSDPIEEVTMRTRFRSLLALALAAAMSPAAAWGAEPHPFTVLDLVAMQRISDPQMSPDGRSVLFSLRTTDLEANKGRFDLWSVDVDGGSPRQLTTHAASDTGGRWSADGRSVYFLSTRSGSSQVWRLPLDGGEPVQLTDLPLDVANLEVAPNGKHLAFSLEVFPDCETIACSKKRLDEREKRQATGRIYESLPIRHWDSWRDGRRNHVFVMPAGGGEPVDLMKGMDADSPSRPFGGAEELAFTPDGRSLVFSAKDAGREEAWSTNFDLFLAPLDGSAAPRKVVDRPAWDTQPTYSPDGKTLAYLAMERAGFEADRFRIVLRDRETGDERVLAAGWDRSANEIVWSRDGRTIYASAQDLGQVALFAIDVASGKPVRVVAKGTVSSPMVARSGRLVYGRDTLNGPVELYSNAPAGQQEKRITRFNDERLAAIRMGEAEQFSFPGAGGETVHAYLVKPAGFDATQKYPVAFLVHGGPQGSFGNHFHYRWNPQTYAGRGYAAVMVDFHGSTGYGQAFTDAIRGDWGGKPLEDLQKGLATALAKYPFLDGERVCALGASYGGYMVNWIAGVWNEPFRCLVSHDGNLDEHAAYYQTEELWFPEWEHGGPPWQNPEGYAEHNPVSEVGKWKLPMLVVHGALDFRVVETSGFSSFTALQRQGIPSKLLYFPDENHWVLKPHNSILWHDTVLGWLDQWLQPPPPPAPAVTTEQK